jgi:flagellar motor switch/type III secretory pathway protein FliN
MAESPSKKLDLLKDVSLLITVELGQNKVDDTRYFYSSVRAP